jgi:hypothetical protein
MLNSRVVDIALIIGHLTVSLSWQAKQQYDWDQACCYQSS